MTTCNKCLLNNHYPGISFDENGTCSLCSSKKTYKPIGEEKLRLILQAAKRKNAAYDALVPISGGKDSTYILHLAVNVYKLNVLTMTYDNGFLSPLALNNIQRAIEITKVKHVFYKPNLETQKKVFKNMFQLSGDFCGACDIGTKAAILKTAHDYSIPIILYGTSPLEEDSFIPDSIQDIARFKYILSKSKDLTRKEINDFLIYPHLNHFLLSYNKKIGKFAKEVSPLFYLKNPTDKEIGDIIAKTLNWEKDNRKEYTKHFDCIAEPLTNYVRNKIYGYERRRCQYSNMIRKDEITREKALDMYSNDNMELKPVNYLEVLKYLNLTEENLQNIITIPPLKYEKHTSNMNKLFALIMNLKKRVTCF
jgi:hypothetical protein